MPLRFAATCTMALVASMAPAAMAGDTPGWLINMGWADLLERVGEDNMPDGTGVVLSQVEAQDTSGRYVPDSNDPQLQHPLYIRRSGGSTLPSSHATFVGKKFYGTSDGMARGVSYVYCFKAVGFLQGDYLNVTTTAEPDTIPIVKVWNHSWVASFGDAAIDARAARKTDFAIERDQDIMCVGLNNGSEQQPLLASAFNVIAVGRRDGNHSGGFWNGGDSDGRIRPDLCGSLYTVSEATPLVSGAAAVLVQTVQDAGLGADAEAPETIKAALMAGAVHQNTGGVPWSNAPIETGPDRGLSTQALDLNSGAGHANVDRSHQVLTGGRVGNGESGMPTGWAHLEVNEGDTATLRFTTAEAADELNVLATWNRTVTTSGNYSTWWVADFDLELRKVNGDSTISLLGEDATEWVGGNVASRSSVGNVEHLHITGLEAGTYEIQIELLDAGSADAAEVALGWWTMAEGGSAVPGDINGDGVVGVDDLLALIGAWGETDHPADLDGSGVVDINDLLKLLSLWVP
ncbi:MAG: hypothetical protein MK101_01675 [Phycisphaerales bacterium]|nr:hypothetical protein [Phycisphaerales bacterium]